MSGIRRHPRVVKTILRRRDRVDPYFVGKFAFSPYHACEHGCMYCDGRAERYFVEGEFDRDVVVRTNAAEMLDTELGKLRERGTVFIGSGVSDAYQPSEADERLMERCGRVLRDRSVPVTLLTKSALVLRDIDIWSELNRRAGFLLMMSIVTLDDSLRAAVEPHASPIDERLETLTAFKALGIPIGVAAMPLLPGLSDSDAQVRELANRIATIGVDFVLFGGLTLRPGRQKSVFLETLRRSFPGQVPYYEKLYAEDRPSGAPLPSYSRDVHRRAAAIFKVAGLPTSIPHRLYRNRLPVYDEVDVLLQQMSKIYADQPAAVRRLLTAIERYGAWLQERKTLFNRRRRLRGSDLEGELRMLTDGSGLARILENAKLADFLRQVIVERMVFDPIRRELVPGI
jgi:DNA repair photolyase